MALLSITDSAKAAGCARSTIYDKIKSGELSRDSSGKIDTAELLRVFGQLVSDNSDNDVGQHLHDNSDKTDNSMSEFLREQVIAAQAVADEYKQDAEQLRADLLDTQHRLQEHRDNAKLLEDKSNEWQHALAARQSEIESARRESVELQERLQSESDARAKAEQLAKQLRNRGFIARLLNRQHEVI